MQSNPDIEKGFLPYILTKKASPANLIFLTSLTDRKSKNRRKNYIRNQITSSRHSPELLSLRNVTSYLNLSKSARLLSLSQNRSSDIIKQNMNMHLYSQENKNQNLEDQRKKQGLKETISKETKKIIQGYKLEKIKDRLDRKFNKSKLDKILKAKVSLTKVFFILLGSYSITLLLLSNLSARILYKRKISLYVSKLSVICKAIGMFIRLLNKSKIKIGKRKLFRIMPRYIRRFKIHIYEKYHKKLLSVIDYFLKPGSISRVNFIIKFRIKLIQKTIKDFLVITRHRKFCLRKLWKKNDKNKEKPFESIQHFYITRYLKDKLMIFMNDKKKYKKYASFLTNGFEASPEFIQFLVLGEFRLPVLRIYKPSSIKKMLSNVYSQRIEWFKIRFLRFLPIQQKKRKTAKNKKVKFK